MSDTHQHHDHEHGPDELAAKKALRPKIERDTRYWVNLEHYEQDPEFLKLAEQEFQSSPLRDGVEDGVARRDFLKLMGASLAMASAGCIRRPVQKIVPYNKQPEEVTLGIPNYYTSTYFDGTETLGLLVKTREGRPIHIEGNPSLPNGQGASIRAQASILNLYDPERLRGPKKNLFNEKRTNKDTIAADWDKMDDEITAQLKKGGVALLTGPVTGPSNRQVIADFVSAFKVRHVTWAPLSNEELREGQKASYGTDIVPFYRFDKARMIVSVDADFLGGWLAPMTYSRQFGMGRASIEKMSRLVVFDSAYSLTGANADIRVKIKPSQQLDVVLALTSEIPGAAASIAEKGRAATARLGLDAALLKEVAKDLAANRGAALVVAGGLPTRTVQSLELQVAVNYLNHLLGAEGSTVEADTALTGGASTAELASLIGAMNKGEIKTLIMHQVNPNYALPLEAGFAEALKKVELVVSTADRLDETASFAHYVIPDNHPLESWGDADLPGGAAAVQQPTIRPMYDTRSFQLSLMTWAFLAKQGPKNLVTFETYFDYLKNHWKEKVHPAHGKGQGFDDFWLSALHKGSVGGGSVKTRDFRSESLNLIQTRTTAAAPGPELVLYPTVMMGDGSNVNASWLHELPDPVSKITWDNFASVSIGFAKKNGIKDGDVLELDVGGRKIEIPAHVQPGLHDDVIAVAIGYGRTAAGKIANGQGVNAYRLIAWNEGRALSSGTAVAFKKTGKNIPLANPQGGQTMEGRQIVVEATLAEYQKKKDANIHRHHIWSIWSGHQYNGHKWGMAVDLNACTGCNACVIACQSENSIPVVGKRNVLQGREMAWIRIDRYYVGTPENAEVVFQPVMCQHCDNAPCETVCPVLATVHTDDGLNAMVYNRCVGTRYCVNNCPYKVRRFNWFDTATKIEKPLHMALNPEVTPRVRGVMEKCSFCVQRIKAAKSTAKLEQRPLKDGEIRTACQSVCPTNSITFGDMNDPSTEVSKKFKDERSYMLLEEWNAAPAVRYMSKIRNNGQDVRHKDAHHKGDHA